MRTKHLIVAMLLIVALFVVKGFYVTQNIRETTAKSHEQFELVSNTVIPMRTVVADSVLSAQIKFVHGGMDSAAFVALIETTKLRNKELLDKYIATTVGTETMNDKELYIRAAALHQYLDQQKYLANAIGAEAVHGKMMEADVYLVLAPFVATVDKVANHRLQIAEEYKREVDRSLRDFDRVMMFSGILTAILAVLAVKYRERPQQKLSRKRATTAPSAKKFPRSRVLSSN